MSVTKISSSNLPTRHGTFAISVYEDAQGNEHVALVSGTINPEQPILVRVHSECLTGDGFGSKKCDCGEQLDAALSKIGKEGGVLLYLRQEGRGIGLGNKIKAYALQEKGLDTVEANEKLGFRADERDYTIGAEILQDLGVKNINLLTNNPKKIEGLEEFGLSIENRVPLVVSPNEVNKSYFDTKQEKLGHLFEHKGVCSKTK